MAWAEYNSAKTPEQRRAHAAEAGRASARARARRRTLREILDDGLRALPADEELRQQLLAAGLDVSYGGAVILAMMLKAARGDVEAAKYVRDTVGERPADVAQLTVSAGQPVGAMDLTRLSDEQLAALAEDRTAALPAPEEGEKLQKVAPVALTEPANP